MATLFSKATGNFTAAATWGVVNATMFNASETTTTALTTSFVGATTYTPGAITITHIGVKLSVRTGTTGTMSVRLAQGGVAVAGTTVTINVADLPVAATADLNGGWIFFKLAAPVTLLAATTYSVQAKTSSASQVSLRSTATSNWAVALVTTTTAAPAASDNLIIGGEYISAGSSNSFTVTMDNTATTDFGSAPTAANSLLTPGLAIGSKGTLEWGTSAATAYYMRMSNSIIVYTGGTLNMGTSGTPCPRDSTMTLFLDMDSSGDYGIVVRNLGTMNTYGQSRTSGKDVYHCKLNANQQPSASVLNVDTDTGWLNTDYIGVANTTINETAVNAILSGSATSSTLIVTGSSAYSGSIEKPRMGTPPMEADVILLTRNVSITAQSGGGQMYIKVDATSTVTFQWTSFQYFNSGANKEGIRIETTTGTFTCNYCSFYNTVTVCWYVASTTATLITITNNVAMAVNVYILYVASGTSNVMFSNNIYMGTNSQSAGTININSPNVTMTNNILVGGTSNTGILVFNSKMNWSGGKIYCGGGPALNLPSTLLTGSFVSCSMWRNLAGGPAIAGGIVIASSTIPVQRNIYIGACTLFGNGTANIATTTNYYGVTFDGIVSNNDATASTPTGIVIPTSLQPVNILNSTFSSASGHRTVHTNDLSINASCIPQIICQNTSFNSTNGIPSMSLFHPLSYIASQRNGGVVNSHVLYKKYGKIRISSGTVHSGSTSLQLQPDSASNKLESSGLYGGFKVPISSGQYCSPTAYVYEDSAYNGSRARLIVKRNGALGIEESVLMTATAGSDLAWQGLSGSTAVVSDSGVLEFVIDCDGTAGNLYVDTFSATLT